MSFKRLWFLILIWACPTVAQDFDIYVSDAAAPYQILKFDGDGLNPQVFINQQLSWPQDILFLEDQGVVLVSNLNNNRINRHDAETGAFIDVFTTSAVQPTRMKIGPDGLLYVLQWGGTGRVKRYQLDGTFVDDFTSAGVPRSIGMDWDASGNLYVSSYNGRNVRRFDPNGNDLGLFISGSLQGPTNVEFDADGNLLVLDYNGGAIRRYGPSGNLLDSFGTTLIQPEGIAALPDGRLLVGNGGPGSIVEFGADRVQVGNRVASGSGGLLQPNAIVLRARATSSFVINAGVNDAWFEPATAGQGMLIGALPDSRQMFVAWFTFDTRQPVTDDAQLGSAGQRWLTGLGSYSGNVATLTLLETTGGLFDSAEAAVTTTSVGTLVLTFDDCDTATAEYTITGLGLSGVIPLQRIAPDNVVLCQALQED